MKWNDDKTSQEWGKILQHKFFKSFNKDIYLEDMLTLTANTILEMENKLEEINTILEKYLEVNDSIIIERILLRQNIH